MYTDHPQTNAPGPYSFGYVPGFGTRTTAYTKLFHRAIFRYAVSFEMSIRLIFGKFPPPRSSTRRVLHVVGCTKRKCGAVFVHLQRGSDKTQNRINECFTPHLNRYENCGAKLFWPNLSKQENECCSLPRFTLKLSDFFVRTEWKTLSVCLSVCDRTKLENNFRIEQHSLWKFHANFIKKYFFCKNKRYWFTILFISFWAENTLFGPIVRGFVRLPGRFYLALPKETALCGVSG